jgi:hypothetical protein
MDSFYTYRLYISEIFLILFIISLWLISIMCCVRRSSLVLCFHNRDVPFFDKDKFQVKKTSTSSLVESQNYNSVNLNENSVNTLNGSATMIPTNVDRFSDTLIQNSKTDNKMDASTQFCSNTRTNSKTSIVFNEPEYYYSSGLWYSAQNRKASVLLTKPTKMKRASASSIEESKTNNLHKFTSISNTNSAASASSINIINKNLVSFDEQDLIAKYNNNSIKNNNKLIKFIKRNKNAKDQKISGISPLHLNFMSLRSDSLITDNLLHNNNPPCSSNQQSCSNSSILTSNDTNTTINTKLTNGNGNQRQMMSTLRRHMFANSHYKTKTQNNSMNQNSFELAVNNNNQTISKLSSEIIKEDSISSFKSDVRLQEVENHHHHHHNHQIITNENLLNPNVLSPRVKECLMEAYNAAKMSKSDSNIKNPLLRTYDSTTCNNINKKPLSLQNSKERHHNNSHGNSIVTLYDDLKSKILRSKDRSISNTSTSTNLSNNLNLYDLNEFQNTFRVSPSIIFDEPSKEKFCESNDEKSS